MEKTWVTVCASCNPAKRLYIGAASSEPPCDVCGNEHDWPYWLVHRDQLRGAAAPWFQQVSA